MIRLLDACIRFLAEKGMRRLFIDGVRGGDEGFQSLGEDDPIGPSCLVTSSLTLVSGFQRWAAYRDVWRNA